MISREAFLARFRTAEDKVESALARLNALLGNSSFGNDANYTITWGPPADNVQSKQAKVTTVDNTVTTVLSLDCSTAATVYGFDAVIQAKGAGATAAKFNLSMAVVNNGGVLTTLGTVTSSDARGTNAGLPPVGWTTPIFTVSGTSVLVQVQGPAATTILWHYAGQTTRTS